MKFINFSIFVGYFCPSGYGTQDPDPQHWKKAVFQIRILSIRKFLGLPDPSLFGPIPLLPSTSKQIKGNLGFYSFFTSKPLKKRTGSGSVIQWYRSTDPDPYISTYLKRLMGKK
jgi:hypothetical protein